MRDGSRSRCACCACSLAGLAPCAPALQLGEQSSACFPGPFCTNMGGRREQQGPAVADCPPPAPSPSHPALALRQIRELRSQVDHYREAHATVSKEMEVGCGQLGALGDGARPLPCTFKALCSCRARAAAFRQASSRRASSRLLPTWEGAHCTVAAANLGRGCAVPAPAAGASGRGAGGHRPRRPAGGRELRAGAAHH